MQPAATKDKTISEEQLEILEGEKHPKKSKKQQLGQSKIRLWMRERERIGRHFKYPAAQGRAETF